MERKRARIVLQSDASDEGLSDAEEFMACDASVAPPARPVAAYVNNDGSSDSSSDSDAKDDDESHGFGDKVILSISNRKAPKFHFSHLNFRIFRMKTKRRGR
jgi:hypothetical protein